jgi:hypothetical protein
VKDLQRVYYLLRLSKLHHNLQHLHQSLQQCLLLNQLVLFFQNHHLRLQQK